MVTASTDLLAQQVELSFDEKQVNFQSLFDKYSSQLNNLVIIGSQTFVQAVDVMQAEFALYRAVKEAESLLSEEEKPRYNQQIRAMIGAIFSSIRTHLIEIHGLLIQQPDMLERLLREEQASTPQERLQVWTSIVYLANFAGRTADLDLNIENDLWSMSDHWLLSMHDKYGFVPGFAVDDQAHESIINSPVSIDWEGMRKGTYYFRPYFIALSHIDFPKDKINDTHAVDILLPAGEVIAVTSGTIVLSRLDEDNGGLDKQFAGKDNYVFVQDTATGLIDAYRHLAKPAIDHPLRHSLQVTAGQDLGPVGMTGLTSTMHLHYGRYARTEDGVLESLPLRLVDSKNPTNPV